MPLNEKNDKRTGTIVHDSLDSTPLQSTSNDAADMYRLGRKQELTRHFRSYSILAFTVIVQATWEFTLTSLNQGLRDGGLAGTVWSFIWVSVGFIPVVASIAEMASMAPTSGGQYHWVSEFAPPQYQKALSYIAGWQATISWQAGNASGPFVTGLLMQSLASIHNPDYSGTRWQGTLIVIANALLVLFANMYGTRWIPIIQTGLMFVHVILLLAIVIALWVSAPHNSASVVFTQFYNGGDWSSMGLAVLVGQLTAIFGCIGSDAGAHMAEETRDAGHSVPVAILSSYLLNAVIGIVLIITICFCIPSVDDALNDPSGYPFIYAFQLAMSDAWLTVIVTFLIVLIFASNVSYLACSARETFAFARDNGLPFSSWIGRVNPKTHVPTNALILTTALAIALSLIYIGSDTAFYAIISLNVVSLMLTYTLSISCVLWRRIVDPGSLPPARWSLGRLGVPINVCGVVFAAWALFWGFWPGQQGFAADEFNWAPVMFAGAAIVSGVLYAVQGRRMYVPPVLLVRHIE